MVEWKPVGTNVECRLGDSVLTVGPYIFGSGFIWFVDLPGLPIGFDGLELTEPAAKAACLSAFLEFAAKVGAAAERVKQDG